jgi:dTDP-4-dehydrorhamnose reductase
MKSVAVLGAGGMLGHKVCQLLRGRQVVGLVRKRARDYQTFGDVFTDIHLLGGVDVLDGDRLEAAIRELEPGFVVNCVGLVKQLEEAEDPLLAVAVNALLPHRLARLCDEIGARLIQVSTDCVFDGARGDYRESDPTDARDLYGRSKALGETLPSQTAAVTLRTSFIGRELASRTHGLIEWFLAQRGRAVDGYARVIYSGLTSLELAAVIRRVIDARAPLAGVHHVASQPISKYDLLMLVRQIYRLEVEVRRSDEPVSNRSLVMEALPRATGYVAPSWPEMIQEMHDDPTPYDEWRGAGGAGA